MIEEITDLINVHFIWFKIRFYIWITEILDNEIKVNYKYISTGFNTNFFTTKYHNNNQWSGCVSNFLYFHIKNYKAA